MRSHLTLLLYILYICCGLTDVGVDAAEGGRRAKVKKARQRKPALNWKGSKNQVDENASAAGTNGLVFGQETYEGEVTENAPVGSLVLTISASQTGNGNVYIHVFHNEMWSSRQHFVTFFAFVSTFHS